MLQHLLQLLLRPRLRPSCDLPSLAGLEWQRRPFPLAVAHVFIPTQNDLNLRYVRLWSAPTTRAQIYLTSNDVTCLAVETIFNGLNVTEEAAKLVVLEKFRFPTKSDCEKFTVDSFVGYAKRDIATWHYKAKGMLFASYLEGLVSRKEYGHFVQRGRHRVPVLPRHQARTLLENNKFITSSTSYNALVAAIIDFLSSVPEESCLLVACSPTVSEAFLRLLNAQFSWFTLKVRYCATHVSPGTVSGVTRTVIALCVQTSTN